MHIFGFLKNTKFSSKLATIATKLLVLGLLAVNLEANQSSLSLVSQPRQIGDLDDLVANLKAMEKVELHLHIGGAWPLSFLKEIAHPKDFQDLCEMINQFDQGVNYHEAFRIFNLIGKIMNSNERIEQGVAALCEELILDHVVYAELRTGLKDLGTGLEGYLQSVLKGIQVGSDDKNLKVGLILSLRRDTKTAVANQTIDLAIRYYNQGVVGIDISGDSTLGNGGHEIWPALMRAKEAGLPITLHIGESLEETPERQMFELLTLQPKRIGHGVHLCEAAQNWIQEHQTLVELCLTSALKTGMIQHPSEHPGLKLLLQGHPVAICTDDPLIFNTSLSEEYTKVALLTGLSAKDFLNLEHKIQNYYFKNSLQL